MRNLLCAILVACATNLLWAQEEILGQATYSRTDLLTKQENKQIWTFTWKEEEEELRILKLVPGGNPETEIITRWGREMSLSEVTLRERLAYPVNEERETNFGHIEGSDPTTGKVVFRWPMFCETAEGNFLLRTHCWALMDNGGKYETLRHFSRGEPLRVLIERKRVVHIDGKIPLDVEDKIQPK